MATKEQIEAAEKKVYSQKDVGEFMTTWKDFPRPGLAAWSERKKAGLMNTARSTRYTPKFRPFDMLSVPNQSLVFLEHENHAEPPIGNQNRVASKRRAQHPLCGVGRAGPAAGGITAWGA